MTKQDLIEKRNFIGAGIAGLAFLFLLFLPLISFEVSGFGVSVGGSFSLFQLFKVPGYGAYAFSYIIFPLAAAVAHYMKKYEFILALLMLIPVLWGLSYLKFAGVGYWLYTLLTIGLIVFDVYCKKEAAKEN